MARGYWQPPNRDRLLACDGFFIHADAVPGKDPEKSWDLFLELVSSNLQKKMNWLKIKKEWKAVSGSQSRFVLMYDDHVDFVVEESRGYYAIFVLIPETCDYPKSAKKCFWEYRYNLRQTLTELFPGCVKYRKNYRQLVDIG